MGLHLGRPEIETNSIGMRLELIPAGVFLMGSPDSHPEAKDDEKPQHRVRVTRPFYLGATEVTVGQFRRFVAATGYRTEAERDGKGGWGWNEQGKLVQDPKSTWRSPGFEQTDEHPVVDVSWNDAAAFCRWLGQQGGARVPLADGGRVGVRLPCRDGDAVRQRGRRRGAGGGGEPGGWDGEGEIPRIDRGDRGA
jgi:formylglycine-generating enzyme required for sulfatase activity